MISIIFWFTKSFIIKLTLGLFLIYSYNLGDFTDIHIEAIHIKKRVCFGPNIQIQQDGHKELF